MRCRRGLAELGEESTERNRAWDEKAHDKKPMSWEKRLETHERAVPVGLGHKNKKTPPKKQQ